MNCDSTVVFSHICKLHITLFTQMFVIADNATENLQCDKNSCSYFVPTFFACTSDLILVVLIRDPLSVIK